MKRITPVILTAFSVLALSIPSLSSADNMDSDGFIVFEAQSVETAPAVSQAAVSSATQAAAPAKKAANVKEVTQAAPAAKPKAVKKAVKKASKRAERKQRKVRKTRVTRTKRAKRASYHRVRKGETLYRISVNSGVKLSRLIKLNKLYGSKKHKIQAGQRIRLR